MTALSRDGFLKTGQEEQVALSHQLQVVHSYPGLLTGPWFHREPGFRNLFSAFAFFGVMSFNMALANTNKWGQLQLHCGSPLNSGLTGRTMHLFGAVESSGRICHHCGECQRGFRLPVTGRIEERRKASSNLKALWASTGANFVLLKEPFHFNSCTLPISVFFSWRVVTLYNTIRSWLWDGGRVYAFYIFTCIYSKIEQLFLPSFLVDIL